MSTTTTSIKSLQQLAWERYLRMLPQPLKEVVCHDCKTHNSIMMPHTVTRSFPADDLLNELQMLEHSRLKYNDTKYVHRARGRTGRYRSELVITHTYDRKRKRIAFRFDDLANPEFWLAAEIPIDDIISSYLK